MKMNDKRIEIGDSVTVFFNRSKMVRGIVDYIPQQTGDSWIILEEQVNLPVYVQSFDYMILTQKAKQ